jgi:peptidoglycan/xylan/chitin deacetylase (PgdA/CDA1 family)
MRLRASVLPIVLALPALLNLFGLPSGGDGPQAPIKLVPIDDRAVAITFDACATLTKSYSFDRAVYDTLKREHVPVTIFVSGRWVEGHPDVMTELAAEPLIEFGDHSYDHPHMTEIPLWQAAQEVDGTEAALSRFGKKGVAFRPPYGEWNKAVMEMLQKKGLPTVLWDVVSGDPSLGTTAHGIIRTVLAKTRPGSIIVFHINGRGWKTAEAFPTVVRELRARGFRFVHVSELLAGRIGATGPAAISEGDLGQPPLAAVFDPTVPAR